MPRRAGTTVGEQRMNRNQLTIVINDPNRYFADGLAACISEHLLPKGIAPSFTDCVFNHDARTMFIALESLSIANCHYLHRRVSARSLDVFILRDRTPLADDTEIIVPHLDDFPTLYRDSQLTDFAKKIQNRAPQHTDLRNLLATSCATQPYGLLTRRETEVLRYLARGISNGAIARFLQISEKTVSAHKRNIMAKLNMIRPAELNYWLLQEGWCESWCGQDK